MESYQNVGWVVGWYGYAAHTTNARVTGRQNHRTQADAILDCMSELIGSLCRRAPSAGSPSLYHTTDAGVTWIKSPLPNQYSLSGIFSTASGNVWASGYDTAVLHKTGNATGTLQLAPAARQEPSHRRNLRQCAPTGEARVECRHGGGTYSLVLIFRQCVTALRA